MSTTVSFVIETDDANALRMHFDATFSRDTDDNWQLDSALCTRIVLMLGTGRHFRTETVDMAAEYEGGGREYTAWMKDWLKTAVSRGDPRVSIDRKLATVDLWEMLDRQERSDIAYAICKTIDDAVDKHRLSVSV